MPAPCDRHESSRLGGLLRRHIPGARSVRTALPDCPGLELYLLSADYPQHELSQEAAQAVLAYPAYWAFCWASGQVMARYLLDNRARLAGKRVLVADSWVRDFDFPGYSRLAQAAGTTVPDLDEFDEFRQVSLYLGCAGELPSADW